MNLDGFSMRPLTFELATALVGGRVDKITQQNKANLTLTIRQPGKTFLLRISLAPQNPSLHLLTKAPENLPEPPTFCMVLRKNLENGRIAAIRQHELDRIIFIDVDSIGVGGKIQTFTLAAELIGKYSNLILVADGVIVDALKKIGTNSSRVRTVLPNQNYQLPPAQDKLDIFSSDVEKILARIKLDDTLRLDKAIMNVCQGFGPQSIRETIFRAGLPVDIKISALDADDFDSLRDALIDIRDAAKTPTLDVEKILARIKLDDTLRLDKAIMNVCQGFGPQSIRETIFRAGLPVDIKISALDAADFDSLRDALIDIRDAAKTPTLDVEKILARIKLDNTLRLDKAIMNVCQGFGPQSIRETIFRAGLPVDIKISALDAADFDSLRDALIDIRDAAKTPTPCMIVDAGKVLAISAVKLNYLRGNVRTFDTLSELLETADEISGSYVPPDKEKFSKLVGNELRRAVNKISVLESELAAAENADDWRIRGDNLSTYRYQLKDHADAEITVPNIYSESGEKISIPLDRRLTIAANVQACYKKYDKLKRSTRFIAEQIELCRTEIVYLESVAHALTASTTLADIDEIRTELIAGGYLKDVRKKMALSRKPQPLKFFAPDGTEILVGKNNAQNDRLTFKIAAPDDFWLHTKNITGSHVIIRSSRVSDETLQFAAEIAAHFSKAQNSSNVPVDYVRCKFVKKPSGAKPGFVIFTNQRTLYVTPRLDRELGE